MVVPEWARIHDRKIRCEYEDPSTGRRCSERATSVDHFTPQAIAPILGLTEAEVNARDNLQYLCGDHHSQKDKDTGLRKKVLLAQLKGELKVGLGEHEQAMTYVAMVDAVDRSMRDRSKNERRKLHKKRKSLRRAS